MKNKHDLTRIEDLGEFIHELTKDDPTEVQGDEDPFAENAFESESSESSDDSFLTEETSEFSESNDSEFESSFEDDSSSNFETDEEETESKPFSFDDEAPALNSFEEDEPAPIADPTPTWTPEPPREQEYKAPETFEDLKKFSESSSLTGMSAEGNPSFSVLIKNVRYIEDVNDIITILRELTLLGDSEEQVKNRLMRGMLLVPRISEYAAIFLAHKLRRFDVDIQIGLSDEIHPPKHKETPELGMVSKHNLYQNQSHNFHFDDPKLEISQIIVSSSPSLDGHQIMRYLGVASEHKIVDSHIVEDEASEEIPRYYQELALRLKAHALKAHSNAVVGLNYQISPLGAHKYRLTCTGNLVWVNKL